MSDRKDDGFDIVCAKCGREETLPFEPKDKKKSAMYCQECYQQAVREKRARERNAPRKKHGTRVSLQIECAECGKETELDYVPKGVPLDEIRCDECFEAEAEGTRWAEVKEQKRREQATEWSFECAECGRTDVLNFEPDPGRDYYCTRCFYEHEEPHHERVEGKESVGHGVFIRRKDDD